EAGGVVLDDHALRVGLLAAEVRRHPVYLTTVRRFEVIVATGRVASGRRDRRRARPLRRPQAVDPVVVDLPALAAGLLLGILVHDLEEAIGADHGEVRRAVARVVLDDALPN